MASGALKKGGEDLFLFEIWQTDSEGRFLFLLFCFCFLLILKFGKVNSYSEEIKFFNFISTFSSIYLVVSKILIVHFWEEEGEEIKIWPVFFFFFLFRKSKLSKYGHFFLLFIFFSTRAMRHRRKNLFIILILLYLKCWNLRNSNILGRNFFFFQKFFQLDSTTCFKLS